MTDDDISIADTDDTDLPETGSELDRVTIIATAHPCPECKTAVFAAAGPAEGVDNLARQMSEDYPVTLDENWREDHHDAVYLYCDSPLCPWHGVGEYADLKRALPEWLNENALSWEERVAEGDLPEGVGE